MTDNTPPEALRLANVCSNLTRYSMDAHLIAAELRRQHTRIAELEAQIEALSGVQALSTAPAEQEEAAQRLRKTLDIDPGDVNDPLHPRYIAGFKSGSAAGRRRAAPAASPTPTPTAEQQAKLGAVYAELPKRRRQFLCTKCGSRECKVGTINEQHPPCECGYLGFAEDLDFNADEMRDFADRTHALRMQQAAPKAAPVTQQAGYAEVIECGNSYAKVKLKGEAFGSVRVGDIFYTAPQQEAQEPVAWLVPMLQTFKGAERVHFTRAPGCAMTDAELIDHMEGRVVWIAKTFSDSPGITDKFGVEHKPKPLYTAPQPAPATQQAPQPAAQALSEMPYEKRKAIQEGKQRSASDAWFHARHNMLDTIDRRNVFRAGFDRGWNAALAAQGGKDA